MKVIALLLVFISLFGFAPEVYAFEPEETETAEIEFVAPKRSSPKAAVMRYFDALYDSYIAMLPVDITSIVDTEKNDMMQNVLNWNEILQMRRDIIAENGYCYVETERFDYEIEYIKNRDLDDQRMDYIRLRNYGKKATVLHFVIKGEEGKAYPPIFALNSQHTVIVTEDEEGIFKIAYHYFPGSEGKFENDLPVTVPERAELEELLADEFNNAVGFDLGKPKFDKTYDAEAAVEYALAYCEEQNPDFYFVGDWYGNCMNFSSQCIWSGFREEVDTPKNFGSMTGKWYGIKGGSSLPWCSVSRFWNWTKEKSCKMQVASFKNVNLAEEGDIVNIGSYVCETPEKYTHALILVDEEKMMMAQNSPACFVYYSDLANNYSRFIRPVSLNA